MDLFRLVLRHDLLLNCHSLVKFLPEFLLYLLDVQRALTLGDAAILMAKSSEVLSRSHVRYDRPILRTASSIEAAQARSHANIDTIAV